MDEYLLPIVEPKYLRAWHEYRESKTPSKRTLRAQKFGHLEKTVRGPAKDIEEAAEFAEGFNPAFMAVREAITSLGEYVPKKPKPPTPPKSTKLPRKLPTR